MEKLYNKLNSLFNSDQNNSLDLEEIQISKINSMFQRIYEFVFSKIYQKSKEHIKFYKYTLLYSKIF